MNCPRCVSRLPQNQCALGGAKHVTLLGHRLVAKVAPVEREGDGFSLVLPLGPGRGIRKVRAGSLANAWPLGVAEHDNKIQIGRHQGDHGLDGAAPVAKTLASAVQADAPLMHAQDLGAEDDLVLVHKPLGVGRAQELSHLDGSRFAVLDSLPAEPRAREPTVGWEERAGGDPTECRVELVGADPPRHAGHVRDVFRASASGARVHEDGVVQASEGPIPVLAQGTREGVLTTDRCGPAPQARRWEGAHLPRRGPGLAIRAAGSRRARSARARG